MCYEANPGWMFSDLFVASKIPNQLVTGSIIVNVSRECVLAGVLIVIVPPVPQRP
jgi:hypothetical protein